MKNQSNFPQYFHTPFNLTTQSIYRIVDIERRGDAYKIL